MTEQEFEDVLALGHERRGTEFKGPGTRTDKSFFARVARAALGMANRQDGGLIVIGIEDKNSVLKSVGLNATDLATWNHDEVSTSLAAYADPSISFDFQILNYKNNSHVILKIHEFEDIPVLCRQDYIKGEDVVLRKGACYIRSRHKPETSEIPSQEDMRDLLDLATDKGVTKFVARAVKSDLIIVSPLGATAPADKELFEA